MDRWRAKRFKLSVGRYGRLVVVLRRFRTTKQHRSKKYRQIVIPMDLTLVREISVSIYTKKRREHSGLNLRLRTAQLAPLILVVLGLIGVGFFGRQIWLPHSIAPVKTFTVVQKTKPSKPSVKPLPASTPTHISIPAVGIDAPIIPVGKDASGSIQMPGLFDWVTGWYKYSPTPGQIGPSVIVGHVDNYKSTWVFWRLKDIKPGDLIYISRTDGQTAVFKATALSIVSQAHFPTKAVYGNINYPGLRLITCTGAFSQTTEAYNENAIVYASMISSGITTKK